MERGRGGHGGVDSTRGGQVDRGEAQPPSL